MRLCTSAGQMIGALASATVLPTNIQGWFPLAMSKLLNVWSPCIPRNFQESFPAPQFESIFSAQLHQFFSTLIQHQFFSINQSLWSNTHIPTRLLEKPKLWFICSSVGQIMSLFFKTLSRLVIAFLPRSKCLLVSWLQSPSTVILELPQNKLCHCFHCFPIYFPWSDGTRCHDLFLIAEF